MKKYTYKNLCQIIGEKVRLKDKQGNQAELSIAEVCMGTLNGDEWEAFTVIYLGEKDFFVPQGIYTFVHEKFGEIELFLSPNSVTEYETVMTRKRTQKA